MVDILSIALDFVGIFICFTFLHVVLYIVTVLFLFSLSADLSCFGCSRTPTYKNYIFSG